MDITAQTRKKTISVLHVENFADFSALRPEQIKGLVELSDYYNSLSTNGLPFVHCRAGVGRTGQFYVAKALMNGSYPHHVERTESIIEALRYSCNPNMVQTEEQCIASYKLEKMLRDTPDSTKTKLDPIYIRFKK